MAGTFYLNYFLLIPKLLTRRKILIFILVSFLSSSLLAVALDYIIWNKVEVFSKETKPEFHPRPEHENFQNDAPKGPFSDRNNPIPLKGLPFFITIVLLSIGLRMTQEWLKSEKNTKELENEKLKAELAALKAQVNPHFFFNVMNSLCSLARKKSDETETYIIKLSELLRYNLNDLSENKVPVSKELDFIRNYIDIQHLRIPSLEPVNIIIKGNTDSVLIEPMLLFPFVENAFKHGGGAGQPLNVKINLETTNNSILFRVENSVSALRSSIIDPDSSGIGQQNIKRRLELLYNNKYNLEIANENDKYTVSLQLQLS
jgi:LytS/YehU family sensor histidine kinase